MFILAPPQIRADSDDLEADLGNVPVKTQTSTYLTSTGIHQPQRFVAVVLTANGAAADTRIHHIISTIPSTRALAQLRPTNPNGIYCHIQTIPPHRVLDLRHSTWASVNFHFVQPTSPANRPNITPFQRLKSFLVTPTTKRDISVRH